MSIFVLDSDGLIKLVKSSIIEQLLKRFSCFISSEVYEEVVIRGKEKLYEDAFIIEKHVRADILKVMKTKENQH